MRDSEVVASIVAGDPHGLALAYDRYAGSLFKYCRTLLSDPADAADAVQDTFVIAATRLDGLRAPERLRAWLYAVARNDFVFKLPQELDDLHAAPLLCAGITTFNSLRHSGAQPGDLVAVLGMGGLGHLGVQYATHMGFNTVAIARGAEKAPFAKQLGAAHYIDSTSQDVAKELTKLGGAAVVLATVTDGKSMAATIGGLGVDGTLVVLGASQDPIEVSTMMLIGQRRNISGWPSGTATDSEDTLKFSERTGVKAMIESYPLARAAEAYARMMSGQAKFRVVITM